MITLATDETLKVTSMFAARQVINLEVKFPPLWEKTLSYSGEQGQSRFQAPKCLKQ